MNTKVKALSEELEEPPQHPWMTPVSSLPSFSFSIVSFSSLSVFDCLLTVIAKGEGCLLEGGARHQLSGCLFLSFCFCHSSSGAAAAAAAAFLCTHAC